MTLRDEIEKLKDQGKPVRQGGWVKGEIYISDDFNDPMDFVSEEEARLLEAFRASNKAEKEKDLHGVAI